MGNSNKRTKPEKPRPDFPLFAHQNGSWAKKILGKLHYFGPWGDPQAALDRYLDDKDDLHAGRTPSGRKGDLEVRDLVNEFLTAKRHLLDTGEITPRTFADYYSTCERIVIAFGKTKSVKALTPSDFGDLRTSITKTRGAVATRNEITRIRGVLKFGYDQGLIDKPIRYGQGFKRPSAKTIRLARADNGQRMFEANELRSILRAATQPLKAMILLGINCGYGNSDVSSLPLDAAEKGVETGWLNYYRPKTGIDRRAPLWPETRAAIQEVIAARPEPKDAADAGLCFVTKYGGRWVKRKAGDAMRPKFVKLLDEVGLKRPRFGFYVLRHTFETIAGGSKDQIAVNAIMGHVDSSMAGVYRERIDDARLQAVVNLVHDWLFREDTST